MNAYKEFLKKNNLRQKDLAQFLGVTESSISTVANGKGNLSESNLDKILTNKKGWDVSMFSRGERNLTVGGDVSGVIVNGDNSPVDNRQYYSDSPDVLRATIDLLDERIKEKDAQIKEKDAQIKQLLDILAKR